MSEPSAHMATSSSLPASPGGEGARWHLSALIAILVLIGQDAAAQVPLPDAKPVPSVQVVPLPHHEASFLLDGVELTRYHFAPDLRRPFLFPLIGKSGRSLTRMGHPHDPNGHSHHNSVWISHDSVDGESFWADTGPGRIVQRGIVRYDDGDLEARLIAANDWLGSQDRVVLRERRGVSVQPLGGGEYLVLLDLQFEPGGSAPATLGESAFGLVGVRMAKTIGANDGGGLIRNSEGQSGEQGENGVFRRPARWVDYSGPIAPGANEGVTLLDHPSNPSFPTPFHVRGDGWMGASLTFAGPITIHPGQPLRLRYGLYVHDGVPTPERIEDRWKRFAETEVDALPEAR